MLPFHNLSITIKVLNSLIFKGFCNLIVFIKDKVMVSDFQVYTAMLVALLASVLAIRLGATLYQ